MFNEKILSLKEIESLNHKFIFFKRAESFKNYNIYICEKCKIKTDLYEAFGINNPLYKINEIINYGKMNYYFNFFPINMTCDEYIIKNIIE